jgi:hypothetical protein
MGSYVDIARVLEQTPTDRETVNVQSTNIAQQALFKLSVDYSHRNVNFINTLIFVLLKGTVHNVDFDR